LQVRAGVFSLSRDAVVSADDRGASMCPRAEVWILGMTVPEAAAAYLNDGRDVKRWVGDRSVDALPYLGPRLPWLAAGDEMVDRSFLAERLRPLCLWWVATVIVGTTAAAGAGRKLGTHRGDVGLSEQQRGGVSR